MNRHSYQPRSSGPVWRVLGVLLCLVLLGAAVWLVLLLRQPVPVPQAPATAAARPLPAPPTAAESAGIELPVTAETKPAPEPPKRVRVQGPAWDHLSAGLRQSGSRRIAFQAGRLNGFPGPDQATALTDEFECVTPLESVTHVRGVAPRCREGSGGAEGSGFPQRLEPGQAAVVHLDAVPGQDLWVRWHGFAGEAGAERLPGALRIEGNGHLLWHRCVRSAPTRGTAWFPAAYLEPGETTVAVTNTGSAPFTFDAFWIEAGTDGLASGAPPPNPRRGAGCSPDPTVYAARDEPAAGAVSSRAATAGRRQTADAENEGAAVGGGQRVGRGVEGRPDRVNAGEAAALRVYVRDRADVPAAFQALLTEAPPDGDTDLTECCSTLDPDLLGANLAGQFTAGVAEPEPFEFAPSSLWAFSGHHSGYWDRRAKTALHMLEYMAAFYHGGGRTLVLDGLTAAGGVFSPWDGKPFAPWYPLRELLRAVEAGNAELRFNVLPAAADGPALDEVSWFGTRGENVCTLAVVGNARIRGERRVRIMAPVPWQGKTLVKAREGLPAWLDETRAEALPPNSRRGVVDSPDPSGFRDAQAGRRRAADTEDGSARSRGAVALCATPLSDRAVAKSSGDGGLVEYECAFDGLLLLRLSPEGATPDKADRDAVPERCTALYDTNPGLCEVRTDRESPLRDLRTRCFLLDNVHTLHPTLKVHSAAATPGRVGAVDQVVPWHDSSVFVEVGWPGPELPDLATGVLIPLGSPSRTENVTFSLWVRPDVEFEDTRPVARTVPGRSSGAADGRRPKSGANSSPQADGQAELDAFPAVVPDVPRHHAGGPRAAAAPREVAVGFAFAGQRTKVALTNRTWQRLAWKIPPLPRPRLRPVELTLQGQKITVTEELLRKLNRSRNMHEVALLADIDREMERRFAGRPAPAAFWADMARAAPDYLILAASPDWKEYKGATAIRLELNAMNSVAQDGAIRRVRAETQQRSVRLIMLASPGSGPVTFRHEFAFPVSIRRVRVLGDTVSPFSDEMLDGPRPKRVACYRYDSAAQVLSVENVRVPDAAADAARFTRYLNRDESATCAEAGLVPLVAEIEFER